MPTVVPYGLWGNGGTIFFKLLQECGFVREMGFKYFSVFHWMGRRRGLLKFSVLKFLQQVLKVVHVESLVYFERSIWLMLMKAAVHHEAPEWVRYDTGRLRSNIRATLGSQQLYGTLVERL